ncbi:TRAM domain-containing protein [Haloarcula amylovorans]|uniref:TRAM domain-containing protein n=1 Tax=Haloarcula amylovorans TaxID=2562280 RepID=UPI00374297AE
MVDVPENEIQIGNIEAGETYRVALLPTESSPPRRDAGRQSNETQGPPVEEGETRRVEIEDIGEQGDGIARVERGYVIIVPEAELGERVAIEVHDVQSNVAFAEVTKRLPLDE